MTFTEEEQERYSRQLALPEFGTSKQMCLKHSTVLIVGAGGLGVPLAQLLVATGVGSITLMDDDLVDLSNLPRQFLYTAEDIGQNKAKVLVHRLIAQNPNVDLSAKPVKATRTTLSTLDVKSFDLVCDCTDNFATRYLLNDWALANQLPLLIGAVRQSQGVVALFNAAHSPTGCYRCFQPEADVENYRENCQALGVLPTTTALLGSLMAQEAIRFLSTNADDYPFYGQIQFLDAQQNKFKPMFFSPSPDCDCGRIPQFCTTLSSVTNV